LIHENYGYKKVGGTCTSNKAIPKSKKELVGDGASKANLFKRQKKEIRRKAQRRAA